MQALNHSEGKIQQDFFQRVRQEFPETYGCLYHVPNGGTRDKLSAAFLVGQGVVRGIQDIHFIWEGKLYLIEMKDVKGVVSTDQKVIHAAHKIQGLDTYIFRDQLNAFEFIKAIILKEDLNRFKAFISPYADANKYDEFKILLSEERKRKAERERGVR